MNTGELLARARREVDDGHLPSCQIALACDGELVLQETFGDATDETRYVIFSACKPVLASAIWILLGDGTVKLDDRAADLVPMFATNGKDAITIEQLLLHTAGIPHAPLGPPAWNERGTRLESFSRWRLNWEPGTRYEYHAQSAWWVLAEVLAAVTGADHRSYVNERVLAPLGLSALRLGGPDAGPVATLTPVGEPMTPEEMEALFGVRQGPLREGSLSALGLSIFNDPDVRAVGVPGGGAISSAADVALFYQALLRPPEPWDGAVVADAVSTVRNTFPDPLTRAPANRALGVVVAGDDGMTVLRGNFGYDQPPRSFGHPGVGGQIAWVDPVSRVSFCYLTNGLDQHLVREARRTISISSLAAKIATDRG